MKKLLKRKPSPAMVVAFVALVATLGGGAAVALPGTSTVTKNDIVAEAVGDSEIREDSVGKSELEKGSVGTREVRNRSLEEEDFANGVLQRGPKGAKGDTGATGRTGATGPRGATGAAGASALDPVPSGQTIRGVVGADYHAHDADASDFGTDVTLPMPAGNDLTDNDVFVNVSGWQDGGGQTTPTTTDTSAGCTGTPAAPTAPAGDVCIYVSGADHAFNLEGYSALFGAAGSRYGFKLKWDASQEGDTFVDATWAYTAP